MILSPEAFQGRWHLSRRIDDRLLRQEGVMSGVADFETLSTRSLLYAETGTLRMGRGPAMTVQRKYKWTFEASEVVVTFDDGRDFHRFVPQGVVASADHLCGDDFYTVSYDFSHWPTWHATWKVLGPRKDYTSVSQYIRG